MKKLLIYVIEDNKLIRQLITQKLSGIYDLTVLEFDNGDSVFGCLKQSPPDLVILDYHFSQSELKYPNGLSFLQALKRYSSVPVIALSGQGEKEVMSAIIEKGATDYISKDEPDFLDDLQKSVNNIVTYKDHKRQLNMTLINANTKFLVVIVMLILLMASIILVFKN